jgi:hypothetical protein
MNSVRSSSLRDEKGNLSIPKINPVESSEIHVSEAFPKEYKEI